jgi:hypothetical protein
VDAVNLAKVNANYHCSSRDSNFIYSDGFVATSGILRIRISDPKLDWVASLKDLRARLDLWEHGQL